MSAASALALLAAAMLIAGCGYTGDIQPPALNLPMQVTDLKAVEHADKILINFTITPTTTEGLPLKRLGKVDLRVASLGGQPYSVPKWLELSKPIPVPVTARGNTTVDLPAKDWAGKEIILAVRLVNPKGRASNWSNLVALTIVQPLEPPQDLAAASVAAGVRVTWKYPRAAPGLGFRVFRKTETQNGFELVPGRLEKPEWVDTNTEYLKTYQYGIQALQKSGEAEAESEIAGPLSYTPIDTFPPAVPGGLTALPGINSIELAWDRNTDSDLHGYRVYRQMEGGTMLRIEDLVENPSYSDKKVESGKHYKYAISAVDLTGNESGPSTPVEITAP